MIRIGFLMNISIVELIEVSTSCTSPLILAIMSPLRSWLKKARGRESILS